MIRIWIPPKKKKKLGSIIYEENLFNFLNVRNEIIPLIIRKTTKKKELLSKIIQNYDFSVLESSNFKMFQIISKLILKTKKFFEL